MIISKHIISLIIGVTFAYPAVSAQKFNNEDAVLSHGVQTLNAWVEINTGNFESNIANLDKIISEKSKLCAVLKADAYGHGIKLVMPSILKMGVECVAVASNDEARLVRQSGFDKRLMRVRTASSGEIEDALKYNMEELIGNIDQAKEVSVLAQQAHKIINIHLALNAGNMSRNGLELSAEQGKTEALNIVKMPGLNVVGIMTHFNLTNKDAVRAELSNFKEQAQWLMNASGLDRNNILLHAANTFATLEVPESHLDMVRVGNLLFGNGASGIADYRPVMQFKSRVAVVNDYPAGNVVGYEATYKLKRASKLANIPVGFSDGLFRTNSNKGHVLIQGHKVPIVGSVTMNTIMVDVTDFPDIRANDAVVLYGAQHDNSISEQEAEASNNTDITELNTIWGNSNHKVIVQ